MPTALRTIRARLEPLLDAALAVVVLALSVQPLLQARECGCDPAPWWGFALVAAQSALLVFRRRWPFVITLVIGGLTAWYGLSSLPDPPVTFAGLVAIYTVAAHGTRREAHLSAVVAAVGIAVSFALDWGTADYQDFTVVVATYVTAWLLGDSARTRRERATELEARATQLERTRAAEAAAAVAAERNRIARELHDSVAHHVSLMVVQAEAGPVVVGRDPGRAVASFDAISRAGKQAMSEMRQLLGALDSGDDSSREPQPGVGQIADLVAGAREAGLDVRLETRGDAPVLPVAVSLAAYRVVQESLTNCLRHASGANVDVLVVYGDDVRVEVRDSGSPDRLARDSADGTGHGLLAMRERVGLVGGTIEVGAHGTGWQVRATLPISMVGAP